MHGFWLLAAIARWLHFLIVVGKHGGTHTCRCFVACESAFSFVALMPFVNLPFVDSCKSYFDFGSPRITPTSRTRPSSDFSHKQTLMIIPKTLIFVVNCPQHFFLLIQVVFLVRLCSLRPKTMKMHRTHSLPKTYLSCARTERLILSQSNKEITEETAPQRK